MYDENVGSAQWPDPLRAPVPKIIQEQLLEGFWRTLRPLSDLLQWEEHLLAADLLADLRRLVLEMMLALNGIQRPDQTLHLNSYLSEQQRNAIEKTLIAPSIQAGAWIGQAVSLVVIYRWYAPQLVERYDLSYPQVLEDESWTYLQQTLPGWPSTISSD